MMRWYRTWLANWDSRVDADRKARQANGEDVEGAEGAAKWWGVALLAGIIAILWLR